MEIPPKNLPNNLFGKKRSDIMTIVLLLSEKGDDFLKDNLLEVIKDIASDFNIKKIILFGSRARGDHSPTSDYDIGIISDNLTPLDKARIYDRVDDIETLKKIDLVFLEGSESDSFHKKIIEEGKVIYEKTKQAG